ncbi:MAG: hypothetical protein ABII82_05260, partial [Verrucomicrobiota bacterium]
EALRTVKTIVGWKDLGTPGGHNFTASVRRLYGDKTVLNLAGLVQRLEESPFEDSDAAGLLGHLMSGTVGSILAFRPTVIAFQTLSYPLAVLELGPAAMARSVRPPFLLTPRDRRDIRGVLDRAPVLLNRRTHGRISNEIGKGFVDKAELRRAMTGRNTWRERIQWPVRRADTWAIDRVILAACARARLDLPDADNDTQLDRAAQLAERASRRTQPVWDMLSRTMLMGDRNPLRRWFTVFKSFGERCVIETKLTRLRFDEEWRRAKNDGQRTAAIRNGLARLFTIIVVNALLEELVRNTYQTIKYRRYPERDDTPRYWRYTVNAIERTLARVPFFGDIAAMGVRGARYGVERAVWDQRRRQAPPLIDSPVTETLEAAGEMALNGAAWLTDALGASNLSDAERARVVRETLRNGSLVVSRWFGAPIEGIQELHDLIVGKEPPAKPRRKKTVKPWRPPDEGREEFAPDSEYMPEAEREMSRRL